MKNTKVVGGGGAIEMELSRYLREYARTISGKQQLVINYFARALEVRRAAEPCAADFSIENTHTNSVQTYLRLNIRCHLEKEGTSRIREKPSLICVFGRNQLFGRLSQVIPMTLAQNSGADGTKVLNQLRQKHAAAGPEGRWWGVDCMNCTVGLAWFKELFFVFHCNIW